MSTNAQDFAPLRFATRGLPERNRLALWRELFGRKIARIDIEPARDRPFWGKATLHLHNAGIRTMSCAMSGGRYRRTPEFLADGNDDVALIASLDGLTSAFQHGREVTLQPGEAVAMRMARPATTIHRDGRFVCVMIPRETLQPLLTNDSGAGMHLIRRENEALRLLQCYVNALANSSPICSSPIRNLAATHIRDLVAMALGASRDGAVIASDGGVRAARRWAIKADINRRIEDPDLSVSTVAADHGISPRYVQALFAEEGTTFSAFVLARRLARAHCLLANPRHTRRRIADIAFSVGFGDLSHFNRAFRRQYGVTPSDVRACALTGPLQETPGDQDRFC